MCLVYDARKSTQDIDALFHPPTEIRKAAEAVAREEAIDIRWLNDAVKTFLSPQGEYQSYLELDHLKVYIAQPEYLLAMKSLSFRIGPEFFDEADIRFLLRYLNVESYSEAVQIITRYYPKEKFPQKTFYALEEILKK